MAVVTFEGVVEAGQVRLLNGQTLPERTTVYVVVPDYQEAEKQTLTVTIPTNPRLRSPHLTRKQDAPRFAMEMAKIEEVTNAGV